MIIKGLFRRYERWNPVHPTSGVFWGMGIGIGCGIGWGPGFGPDVIGYVGAGCGVGFSVGITLAGFGIGLPANWLLEVPYNATNTALNLARSSGLVLTGNLLRPGRSDKLSRSGTETDHSGNLFNFRSREVLDLRSTISACSNSAMQRIQIYSSRFLHRHKGDA